MRLIGNIIITAGFLFVLFGMGIATIKTPDRELSEIENRKLAQMPVMTRESLLSGEYFKQFETYFADQLIFRDDIIYAYTKEELFLDKTYINNIVVTKDHWLLGYPSGNYLTKEIDQSTANLKKLVNSPGMENVEFFMVLNPYKTNVLTHKYPSHIEVTEHSKKNVDYFVNSLPEQMKPLILTEKFKENFSPNELEKMYFHTDHHWNINGAFNGYQMTIDFLNDASEKFDGKPYKEEDFNLVCNNEAKFIGSNSQQLYHLVSSPEDKVCNYPDVFDPESETLLAKDWAGTKITNFNEIYSTGFNQDEVKYGHMFTWDLPEIVFESKKAEQDNHVLILKDSYVNPLQPFFGKHFKRTSILDLRHYKEKTVEQYVKDNKVDIVIFMYNDTNLTGEMYNVQ
jgi:hypothetical protein